MLSQQRLVNTLNKSGKLQFKSQIILATHFQKTTNLLSDSF